jgi:hypothetical protein
MGACKRHGVRAGSPPLPTIHAEPLKSITTVLGARQHAPGGIKIRSSTRRQEPPRSARNCSKMACTASLNATAEAAIVEFAAARSSR